MRNACDESFMKDARAHIQHLVYSHVYCRVRGLIRLAKRLAPSLPLPYEKRHRSNIAGELLSLVRHGVAVLAPHASPSSSLFSFCTCFCCLFDAFILLSKPLTMGPAPSSNPRRVQLLWWLPQLVLLTGRWLARVLVRALPVLLLAVGAAVAHDLAARAHEARRRLAHAASQSGVALLEQLLLIAAQCTYKREIHRQS